ncbi:MAG: putative zinc ribbon protein [Providencia heimbachae]|nr:putative zinc ribbon protein [Providencia heimbachae]
MMKNLPASIRLHIGLTSQLKPIGAQEAAEEPLKQYQCPHCQDKLVLNNNHIEYWFVHIDNVAEQKCLYCQAEFNQLRRDQALAQCWRWLAPLVPVTQWYCVLCQQSYSGMKGCPCCQQGIYSTDTALIDASVFKHLESSIMKLA